MRLLLVMSLQELESIDFHLSLALSLALYFLKKLPNATSLDYTCRNAFLFILIFILNLRKQGELKYKTTDFMTEGRSMSGLVAIHCSDGFFSCTLILFFV